MVNIFCYIFFLLLVSQVIRYVRLSKSTQKALDTIVRRQAELYYINRLIRNAIVTRNTISDFFTEHLDNLIGTIKWKYHSLFRLDEETQQLIIRFTGNLPDWYMKELSTSLLVKVGDASVGRAVAINQPVTIQNAVTDPRFYSVKNLTGATGYKSLCCCPVVGQIKTYAGFCTYSNDRLFTAHDTQFFLTCANYFGFILEYMLLKDPNNI